MQEGKIINIGVSIVLNLLGATLIIVIMRVVYRDPSFFGSPTVLLVGAVLCFFFANLDRIETLKAGSSGFEAKTREVQAVVDEAKATVASLRELAVTTASFQVDLLAAAGRFGGGGTAARKDGQKAHLLERLKGLGLTDEQLAEIDRPDREWVLFDYTIAVLQPLNVSNDPQKAKAYASAFTKGGGLTPAECENLLNEFHVDDDNTKGLLKDYQYYYDTGKRRRPDVWRNRDNH
ncbi:MAG: hypothetical protein JWQ55_3269 [Rhodopila sp.]|nr:hypothetical protein [Rhodopila sp.]